MGDSLLTATTLSHWLYCCGDLPYGAVADIRVKLEIETTISRLVFLTVTYPPPTCWPICLEIWLSNFLSSGLWFGTTTAGKCDSTATTCPTPGILQSRSYLVKPTHALDHGPIAKHARADYAFPRLHP